MTSSLPPVWRTLLRNGVIVLAYNTAIAALLAATGYGDGFWINLV